MAAESEEPVFDASDMTPLPAAVAVAVPMLAAVDQAASEVPAVAPLAAEAGMTDEQRELARQAKAAKRKKRKANKGWKEAIVNTSVYVTGLPQEVTPGTLQAHFAHCGALKRDLENKVKLKIYTDDEGKPKGDARLTFARPESMPLAKLLDESWFDVRHQIRVAEAAFKPKDDFVAPESKYTAQELAKRKKQVQVRHKEQLQGTDEETRRHIILKNVFSLNDVPTSSDASARFFKELKEDFLEECGKFGDVESIKVFERNPLGVVALKFRQPPAAVRCLEVLDGRFFGGHKLGAEWYDGYSNYNVQESEADQKRRIDDFGKWLEDEQK